MRKIEYKILTDDIFVGEKGKYYYFYCITNKENNKKYWGVHSTTNLDDGYRGSGRLLLQEMKTQPLSNYYKEIIKFFNDEQTMYAYEESAITTDVVKDKMTYNLHTGGSGSWDFTTGRVTVKDENSNFILVDMDDERYLNGTLVHNMKGLIHAKDKNGKSVTISKDEYYSNPDKYKTHIHGNVLVRENGKNKWMRKDEYENKKNDGSVAGITKGFGVFKDINGNIISCPINDPRVLSGELVGSTSGLGVYKCRNDYSKTYQTTADDPRVLSGELVGINYGIVHCINPITLEKFSVSKDDERYKNGEIISVTKYRNSKLKESGQTLKTRQAMSKDDYYDKYQNIIDMCKQKVPHRIIAEQYNTTLRKIAYIWKRYRNAK